MSRKKSLKKHSVKASFRVMELAKAGSSIELEIFAVQGKRLERWRLAEALCFGMDAAGTNRNGLRGQSLRT
jgi:hypothetical protein